MSHRLNISFCGYEFVWVGSLCRLRQFIKKFIFKNLTLICYFNFLGNFKLNLNLLSNMTSLTILKINF